MISRAGLLTDRQADISNYRVALLQEKIIHLIVVYKKSKEHFW